MRALTVRQMEALLELYEGSASKESEHLRVAIEKLREGVQFKREALGRKRGYERQRRAVGGR